MLLAFLASLVISISVPCSDAAKLDMRTLVAKNNKEELLAAVNHPDFASHLNKVDPRNGQTPLMSAVLSGKTNAVEALLEVGADATVPENDGYTPMHGAGFQGRASIVPILAAHGVPLDSIHEDGYAPIHRACWGKEDRHTDTVAAFITAGIAHDMPAANGKSCYHMTMNKKTLELLRKHETLIKEKSMIENDVDVDTILKEEL